LSQKLSAISGFLILGLNSAWFAYRAVRHNEMYRKIIAGVSLRTPFIGGLVKQIVLARFCLAMELLLKANTPLLKSLDMVKSMISFYPLEEIMSEMIDGVKRGKSLSYIMTQYNIFPERMKALLKIAEETNTLQNSFEQCKIQFENKFEMRSKLINSFREPILIIFIGLFVGFILVSMYLSIFKMNSGMFKFKYIINYEILLYVI
jgi:type IV pilus assembly protein PilC